MPREGIFAQVIRGGRVKVGDAIEALNESAKKEKETD